MKKNQCNRDCKQLTKFSMYLKVFNYISKYLTKTLILAWVQKTYYEHKRKMLLWKNACFRGKDVDIKLHFRKKKGIIYWTFQLLNVGNGKRFTQLIVPRNSGQSLSPRTWISNAPTTRHKQNDWQNFTVTWHFPTLKGRTTKVPLGEMPIFDEPFLDLKVLAQCNGYSTSTYLSLILWIYKSSNFWLIWWDNT